jgi:predicted adenine nucleotide alpha hydrolase (AANH) superfamily ATPase
MDNITLTRKELYDLVWSTPLCKVAKDYLITTDRLKKICNRLNIPLPESSYWSKIQFNKQVQIFELPDDHSGQKKVCFGSRKIDSDSCKSSAKSLPIIS